MSRRRWLWPLALVVAILAGLGQAGCCTLLHPHRRGVGSGVMDPEVVAMNVFWLCMGVLPGIVSFWVDARTGALYLPAALRPGHPAERTGRMPAGPSRLRPMRRPPLPALPPPPPDPRPTDAR